MNELVDSIKMLVTGRARDRRGTTESRSDDLASPPGVSGESGIADSKAVNQMKDRTAPPAEDQR